MLSVSCWLTGFNEDGYWKQNRGSHYGPVGFGISKWSGALYFILTLATSGRPPPLCIHCLHAECELLWNNNSVISQAYNTTNNTIHADEIHEFASYTGC